MSKVQLTICFRNVLLKYEWFFFFFFFNQGHTVQPWLAFICLSLVSNAVSLCCTLTPTALKKAS